MKHLRKQIYIYPDIFNVLVCFFIFFYSGFIVRAKNTIFGLKEILLFSVIVLAKCIVTHLFTYKNYDALSTNFEKQKTLHEKPRTILLKKILRLPSKKALENFLFFISFSILFVVYYYFYLHINIINCITAFLSCVFISFIASLFTLDCLERITSPKAKTLVTSGIDTEQLTKKKYLGSSINSWFILYLVIPALLSNVFSFVIFLNRYINSSLLTNYTLIEEMIHISVQILLNTALSIILCLLLGKRLSTYSTTMTKTLESLVKKDVLTTKLIQTDLSTEFSSNMYLVNNVIKYFRKIYQQNFQTGKGILTSTHNLAINAGQTSTVSLQQSSGINQIVSVMENSKKHSKNNTLEIEAMAQRAKYSAEIVQKSFLQLNTNLHKMQEITDSNIDTILGIKELGEKIDGIWHVVTLIENIAEQTNVIAFNAELESSSAGKTGEKFHIVANEIHRLASSITDSVNEIKERITNIQHESDNLIISSESGTEKIREGGELAASLKTKFENISSSSEITAESADQITDIVNQQDDAFEQILVTIRQLATGVESFTETTATITVAAEKLKEIASHLSKPEHIEDQETREQLDDE